MTPLRPVTRDDQGSAKRALQRVIGEPITDIWYRPAGELPVDAVVRWNGLVHDVDIDIMIFTISHVLTISWARNHLVEGLALCVEERPANILFPEEWCSVASLVEWNPFMGHFFSDFSMAWHTIDPADVAALWSIRLINNVGVSCVFALGEIDREGNPTYHPDGILAIFDEDFARHYRIPSSSHSSWTN